MQNDMQTILNENIQALANYANTSSSDTNATETTKEQIIEVKSAQTAANKKISNLTGQVIDMRQDYSSNNNRKARWYNRIKDQYKVRNH